MLLISLTVLMFAMMDTLAKYLTRFYPVSQILGARFFVHTLIVVVWVGSRLGLGFVRTSRPGLQIVRGILLPVASLLFVMATKQLPIAEATAIVFVSPLMVTVMAVFFLKERVTPGHWLAIVFGFVGVLVVIRPGSGVFTWASVFPLGTAAAMAAYQVLTRLGRYENVYTSYFYPGLVGSIGFGLALPFFWVAPQSVWHCTLLLLVGLLGGTSHLILIKALTYAPAAYLAPFTYTQLVWATLGGFFLFGDFPDEWTFVGIAMLAAGGLYLATRQRAAASSP